MTNAELILAGFAVVTLLFSWLDRREWISVAHELKDLIADLKITVIRESKNE